MTNVHEALALARAEDEQEGETATVGARIKPSTKDQLEAVCRRNGTTPSSFLRQCALALVRDYTP